MNIIRFGEDLQGGKGRFGVTFESVGDETSVLFESHFLAFIQGVFPKIISRSVDITACVPRREPQYSFVLTFLFLETFIFKFFYGPLISYDLDFVFVSNDTHYCSGYVMGNERGNPIRSRPLSGPFKP